MQERETSDYEFTAGQVLEITGVSYRQLDHWVRRKLITPSIDKGEGSGRRRRFSRQDVVQVKLVKVMRDSGLSLKKIEKAFATIRQQLSHVDLTAAHLVVTDSEVVLVDKSGLVELVSGGQVMFNVLPLGQVAEVVDRAVVEKLSARSDSGVPSSGRVSEAEAGETVAVRP